METALHYCPICEIATRREANGKCLPCKWWERLHHNIEVLSRAEVLANTNDGTEYVPPVLWQEVA